MQPFLAPLKEKMAQIRFDAMTGADTRYEPSEQALDNRNCDAPSRHPGRENTDCAMR